MPRSAAAPADPFVCILVNRARPRFDPAELVPVLTRLIAAEGVPVALVDALTDPPGGVGGDTLDPAARSPRAGIDIGGVVIAIEAIDRPALPQERLTALDFGHWPSGLEHLARMRGHVRLREHSEPFDNGIEAAHDRAAAVTVSAAAVAALTGATGVIWPSSRRALSAPGLVAAVARLKHGQAPLDLWLGLRTSTAGALMTRGLHPFAGVELGLADLSLSREAATELLRGVAGDILAEGRLPAAGEQLRGPGGQVYQVSFRAAGPGMPVPLLILASAASGSADGALAAGT